MRPGLVLVSQLPPARSETAAAGAGLRRILRRAGYRRLRGAWPLPEDVDARLAASRLNVYHVSNDLDDREVYELAVTYPGLVVLRHLELDRLILGLIRARDPLGVEAGREILAAGPESAPAPPWSAHLVRRARGVVVHSSADRASLEALGCRTPIFVAPAPSTAGHTGGQVAAYREAVERTAALTHDPVRWTLARWAGALADVGTDRAGVARGYGSAYADALGELAGRIPG